MFSLVRGLSSASICSHVDVRGVRGSDPVNAGNVIRICAFPTFSPHRGGVPRRPSRRCHTANPACAQIRTVCFRIAERSMPFTFLIRDRHTKFRSSFDAVFAADGIRIIKTPVQAPRANTGHRAIRADRPPGVPGPHAHPRTPTPRSRSCRIPQPLQRPSATPIDRPTLASPRHRGPPEFREVDLAELRRTDRLAGSSISTDWSHELLGRVFGTDKIELFKRMRATTWMASGPKLSGRPLSTRRS